MSLDLMLSLSFAINSLMTLDELVPFEGLPPLLFPSPHPHTCSDKFCQILICLTDQFSIILRRIPMTHLEQVLQQTIGQYQGLILPRAQ